MIKKLNIENFRGIKSLEIEGLSNFNIFIGANGIGKTSILEAVTLAASGRDPESFFLTINARRHFSSQANDTLKSLFPGMQVTAKGDPVSPEVTIDYQTSKKEQRSGQYSFSFHGKQVSGFTFENGESVDHAYETSYQHPNQEAAHNQGVFITEHNDNNKTGMIRFGEADKCTVCLNSKYIPFGIEARPQTAKLIEKISSSKSEHDLLIKTLQIANNNLEKIQLIGTSVKAFLKDQDNALPLSALGSGFSRLFEIMVYLSTKPDVISIDEIDSGLHHSVMEKFWETLLDVNARDESQLFCTTHSEELLEKTLKTFKDCPEKLAIFRIEHARSGKMIASRISYEALRYKKEELITGSEYAS